MELNLKDVQKKEVWEDFLQKDCEEKTFLSSWNWGEFQKALGNKIWRWGIYEGAILIGVVLIIKISAKRGSFLFLPHGPNIKKSKSQILKILLEKMKKIAKEENCSFIRVAPIWKKNEENIKIFKDLGFKKAPIFMHPEISWELNIGGEEEEILKGMRKTTRYLIKQASKNPDIKILKSEEVEAIEKFNALYQATVLRHHFTPFSLKYLKNEFFAFEKDKEILVLLGEYKKEIVAGGIFVFWSGIAFYHHGASNLKYSKIPVSYLLLWEAIKEARKRNCKIFNFWGIADTESKIKNPDATIKKHPWYGLSLFKIGFGGNDREYVCTQDFIFSCRYWINWVIEKLRRIKRGI